MQELTPCRLHADVAGCGAEAGVAQDTADRRGAHAAPEAPQFALDPGVAPGGVLAGQAQDEGGELLGDGWPAGVGGFLLPLPAQ